MIYPVIYPVIYPDEMYRQSHATTESDQQIGIYSTYASQGPCKPLTATRLFDRLNVH